MQGWILMVTLIQSRQTKLWLSYVSTLIQGSKYIANWFQYLHISVYMYHGCIIWGPQSSCTPTLKKGFYPHKKQICKKYDWLV